MAFQICRILISHQFANFIYSGLFNNCATDILIFKAHTIDSVIATIPVHHWYNNMCFVVYSIHCRLFQFFVKADTFRVQIPIIMKFECCF